VNHAEYSLLWHFCIEDSLCVGIAYNFYDIAFLHVFHTAYEVGRNRSLVECLLIHEYIIIALFVEVLVWTALDAYILEALTDVESALENTSVSYVLKLNVHDCVAFARLAMLEVDAYPDASVHTDSYTLLDVL
jgi:hypothetical protein